MRGKRLAAAAAAAACVVAVVGLAHVPAVQRLAGVGCPFGAPPDATKLEALRVKSAASLRGAATRNAPARPAFGFTLDASTKDEVRAWGKRVGATCEDALGEAAIRCEHARAEDRDEGPRVADAFFRFDPGGRLVGVDVMREPATAEAASALFEALVAARTHELGAPTTPPRPGDSAPTALAAAGLSRAAAEYRFADYAADVSVTNFGDGGIVVREQARSLATSTHLALQSP